MKVIKSGKAVDVATWRGTTTCPRCEAELEYAWDDVSFGSASQRMVDPPPHLQNTKPAIECPECRHRIWVTLPKVRKRCRPM